MKDCYVLCYYESLDPGFVAKKRAEGGEESSHYLSVRVLLEWKGM